VAIFGVAKSIQSPGMLKNSKNHGIPTEQRLMEKFQLTPKNGRYPSLCVLLGFTFVSLGLGQHFFFQHYRYPNGFIDLQVLTRDPTLSAVSMEAEEEEEPRRG